MKQDKNTMVNTTGVVNRGDDSFVVCSSFKLLSCCWSRVLQQFPPLQQVLWYLSDSFCALKTVGVFWWKRSWSWNPVDFVCLQSPYIVKISGSYSWSWFIFQPRKGWCTGVDRIGSNLFPQLLVSVLFLVLNTCDLVDIYCLLGLCNYGNTMVFVFVVIFRSRPLLYTRKKNKKHDKIMAHGIAWYIYLHLVDYCMWSIYIYIDIYVYIYK